MTLKSNTMWANAPVTREPTEMFGPDQNDDRKYLDLEYQGISIKDSTQLVSEILGNLEQRYANIETILDINDSDSRAAPVEWFLTDSVSSTLLRVVDILSEGFSPSLTSGDSRLKISSLLDKKHFEIRFQAIHSEIKMRGAFRIRNMIEVAGGTFELVTTLAGIDSFTFSFANDGVRAIDLDRVPLRSGTILVIEDDRALRDLTKLVLNRGGFKVICAESSEEALELYQVNHSIIDAVIADLNLAGNSGLVLAKKLWDHNPTLQVLFTSGDPQGARKVQSVKQYPIAYLEKPYRMKALVPFIESSFEQPGE